MFPFGQVPYAGALSSIFALLKHSMPGDEVAKNLRSAEEKPGETAVSRPLKMAKVELRACKDYRHRGL